MRLCFVCPEYPPGPHGGVGTFVQIMARALVKEGHAVRVIGIYPPSYPAQDWEDDNGVNVWRLREGPGRFGWLLARRKQYRLVKNWVDNGEVDLIEASDSYGWFAGWPRLSVPLLIRAHGSLTYYAHELGQSVDRVGHLLEARSYRRADFWTSVSQHAGSLTQELFSLRCPPAAVLYNPVPVPPTVPSFSSRNRFTVVFTGTLSQKKGIISLLAAWPLVKERFEAARLDVFGKDGVAAQDGESMQAYLRKRLPRHLQESVRFHGHVPREEVLRALMEARVAVFPSYSETFGLAAAEAMACGCPTIYTTLTCGPEIIRDGVDGLLVDPDDPSGIARAVISVLSSDTQARQLAENARRRVVERYTLERLIPQNEAFFRRVIDAFKQ